METGKVTESEDILFDSLQALYDYQPITLTTYGAPFAYDLKLCPLRHEHTQRCAQPVTISLHTPDTDAANWALHASSIWASSMYLADHLIDLNIQNHIAQKSPSSNETKSPVRILELGASAGLPSILIAKLHPDPDAVLVTASDYPDEKLIRTLSENVEQNAVSQSCRVLPYAWGSDPVALLDGTDGFDLVIATDTLWNPELHDIYISALKATLRKSCTARAHMVVGLHTGRYTIESFLTKVVQSGFDLESTSEKESNGELVRDWDVSRAEEEDERERRKWVIWIQLKWTKQYIVLQG